MLIVILMYVIKQKPIIQYFFSNQEDKPEVIVERVAEKNVLDSAMRAALLARVGQEMDKRCDKCWEEERGIFK